MSDDVIGCRRVSSVPKHEITKIEMVYSFENTKVPKLFFEQKER